MDTDTTPATPATAELVLDVCTPEGKTWAADITDGDRDWLRWTDRNVSGSGKTGTQAYVLHAGRAYETNEGRRRLGRRFWTVTADGALVEHDTKTEALAAVRG